MASAVGLRDDFYGAGLRRLARLSSDANQVRRLLALAVIYDGGARQAAAKIGGVGLQTVRDWVLRFNARGPEGLLDGKAPGPRPVLGAVLSVGCDLVSTRWRSVFNIRGLAGDLTPFCKRR